jgi:hypothetical protein
VSALWERRPGKLAAGISAGFLGGGLGGPLGYGIYANLIQEFDPKGWLLRRLCEGFSGGIIGVTLWVAIAVAERFIIFKRKTVEGNHKHCHVCDLRNPLNTWYCENCGSVLQEAAVPSHLHLSPYTTLERVKEMFRFLSRLSAAMGFIAGTVVFAVIAPGKITLAVVALVMVASLSYTLLIFFSSFAETIQIFIKR